MNFIPQDYTRSKSVQSHDAALGSSLPNNPWNRGEMGGQLVIKGTRIEPGTIVVYEEHGYTPEQTHADYPTVSVDTITKIRAFAASPRPVP